ncbi:MAG: ACT domain-containing protein [Clostridiales bacterium]|nr:ACT domain-containing protein [Clostridiales bacterium]
MTAYLGDENSYSHAAAMRLVNGGLKGYNTMTEVLAAAVGECEWAVLPLENNVEGTVNEVYDALFDSGLYISRQIVLPVRHSLIAQRGAKLEGIQKIMSHPQAIAQCRKFVSEIGVPVIAMSSTSAALGLATDTVAAIAFRPKEGQIALAEGIQDSLLNATRFALLSKKESDRGNTVSIAFDLVDGPGALLRVLSVFDEHNINLTRILSRPHRSGSGEYRFFTDFDFSLSNTELNKLLQAAAKHCTAFRCLGRYDCDRAQL